MRAIVLAFLLLPAPNLTAAAANQTPPSVAAPKPEKPAEQTAPAETTEWMSLTAAEERARQFRKDGRAMVAIECRADLALDVDSGEGTAFRFASVVNDGSVEWTWREFSAPELKERDRDLGNEGFARVSTCEFTRQPSGQKRICALWHK